MKNKNMFLVILVSLFVLISIVSVKASTECNQLLSVLTISYGGKCGDGKYDKRTDFNNDKKIDFEDQMLLSTNYDDESWCKEQLEKTFNPCDIPSNIGEYATELLSIITESYGKECGDTKYNKIADIDNSKKVDFEDLMLFSTNCEDESWCTEQLEKTFNPCETEPECIKEGEWGWPLAVCCEGLKNMGNSRPVNGVCTSYKNPSFVCTNCGDGKCGLGENYCNCPEDCIEAKECVGEGRIVQAFGEPKKVCCEGLHEIWSGYRNGVVYCTSEICGDGQCKSVENKLNCPTDCTEVIVTLDYVDIYIEPKTQTINYGDYAKYEITVKDKHPQTKCAVGSKCKNQIYTYKIDVNNIPFLKEYKKQVTLSVGEETSFALTVKPYQLVAIEEPIEERKVAVEKEEIPQITEQNCDLMNHCPEGLDCFNFPSIGLRCAELNPCAYYKCPEGTECLVQEIYPSVVKCSCVGPECPITSGDEDTVSSSSEYTKVTKIQKITENVVVKTSITGKVVNKMSVEGPEPIHPYYAKQYKFNVKATLLENPKIYDIDYAMLIIKPEIPVQPPDFPTEEITIKLYKGWNLISLPGKLVQFSDNGCTSNRKLLGFVYIKEKQKYVTLQEAQNMLGDGFTEYLAKNAFWIYSYEDCNLRARVDVRMSYSGINLYEGWNLVPITEDMVGGYLSDIMSGCDIQKIYNWDSQNQEWKKITIDYIFLNSETYYGFITKVSNNCMLGGVNILEIPEIPEDD